MHTDCPVLQAEDLYQKMLRDSEKANQRAEGVYLDLITDQKNCAIDNETLLELMSAYDEVMSCFKSLLCAVENNSEGRILDNAKNLGEKIKHYAIDVIVKVGS